MTIESRPFLYLFGKLQHHSPHHYQRHLPLWKTFFNKWQKSREKVPPSKPFRSVSAKLRAARVKRCTRDTFSRSFMFDPEGIQLLQARRVDLPAGCISEAVRKQSFCASDRVRSEGPKYNQEFSHPVVMMDMASCCVPIHFGQCESVGLMKQEKANPFWIPSKQTANSTMGKWISRTVPYPSNARSPDFYSNTL